MKKVYRNEILDYKNFEQMCLIGIKFINCKIRFCNFKYSDLSYAIFDSCDLYCSNFDYAIIYTTRFHNCDATKAIFAESYLNGIRIKDTVVTYTNFGNSFNTGKERKPIKIDKITDKTLVLQLEQKLPDKINNIESQYDCIHCTTTGIAISFIQPEEDNLRVWRRKSEIAKCVKNILEENGYHDKSLEYYYHHRKFLRKSHKNIFSRFLDYFFGELFWGYGVKVSNPVIAYFVNCAVFSIVYSVLPFFDVKSGILTKNQVIHVFDGTHFDFCNYLEILYSSILISSLSVFGDIHVVGIAKIFAILHVLFSILSLGLGITALTKKMANI